MQKKSILNGIGISLGTVGLFYVAYRRLMKINSRAYKNARNINVGE